MMHVTQETDQCYGMHITDNGIFTAFEMKDHEKARAEAEKEKKRRLQQQTSKEKALEILGDDGATLNLYLVKNLDCLLVWHQV